MNQPPPTGPDDVARPPEFAEHELAAGRPARPLAPPPVVVPRWVQAVVLPLALLGVWALARAAGTVLLILLAASTIALILNPIIKQFERGRIPRGMAILLVYLGFFAALGGIGVLLSDPISTQVTHLEHSVPHFVHNANKELASVQSWLDRNGLKIKIQQQGQTALQTLQKDVLKRSNDIVSFSQGLLTQVVTLGFDLVLTLVLSVYLLVYARDIGNLVRRLIPPGDGSPEDDYPLLVQRAVYGYVRGQLLFSFVMGTSAALALVVFGLVGIFPDGERYAIFFGGFYGLMEFIPYIGPIIGPVPAVLVALFTHPISAVWVILLFVALQQLEGHFVAPQVFRISLRINPIIIILALLIGYQLYGIAGALLALPIAAVVRQTVLYLRRHTVLEPWGTVRPPDPDAPPGGDGGLAPCPECGTPADAGDVFCRICGASLTPRVRTPG